MAFSMKLSLLILIFSCSFFVQGTLAEVVCEALPQNLCSFAISSSGKRCVLEKYKSDEGGIEYTCKTSEVVVETLPGDYVESERCVSACGVDRSSVGISSDDLITPQFTATLCSPDCYKNCPNIVDLYFNLAAGEGVFLPALCEKQRSNPHRAMLELMNSSGDVAADVAEAYAPVPSPSLAPAQY